MSHSVALNFADGKTFFISINEGELLLDAAFRQGIKLPLDCREGVCGTCQGQCESGRYEQEYVDEDALSELDLEERKVLACQTRVQSDASFYFDHDSNMCGANDPVAIDAVLTRVDVISETTAVIYLDASHVKHQLKYLPGQYARLKIPNTESWRSYSFANCSNVDNELQFLIRLLPDGVMSNYLRNDYQIGDKIELEAPLGSFYLREVENPLIFVAGGTGLSAFLGMLDDLKTRKDQLPPIKLFYGVNKQADLCEEARLEAYRQCFEQFEYHPVIGQATEEWHGKVGFIHEHLDEMELKKQPFDMYLCGPPPMIDAVKTWLSQSSVADYKIYSEKFLQSNTTKTPALSTL
ncbi:anthranilate 1,2-dioxygenase electron transfer component AntC [Acinetobacter sp. B10A]|uniref:anthranilate 1,2-dioxygenase electron transfer component AntC n=1 Tax=Acinetobacter baretiae TaxID=2605383 RepID=UPI001B3C7035|nr:anthranilate 1,2-dioxygenase electron transfer component AntC [Acinetobacter baretiae]MBF7685415.1 anthranilate 1,2-dioxygenase electron transfer component AntC [Acinetobacter baretiae]